MPPLLAWFRFGSGSAGLTLGMLRGMQTVVIPQPWAYAAGLGVKVAHSVGFYTPHIGPLLVVAHETIQDRDGELQLREKGYDLPDPLCQGVIVAQVDLIRCVPDEVARDVLPGPYRPWLSEGFPYALIFGGPAMLAKRPVRAHCGHGLIDAPANWRDAFLDSERLQYVG